MKDRVLKIRRHDVTRLQLGHSELLLLIGIAYACYWYLLTLIEKTEPRSHSDHFEEKRELIYTGREDLTGQPRQQQRGQPRQEEDKTRLTDRKVEALQVVHNTTVTVLR